MKIYLNEITEKQNIIDVSPTDNWATKAVSQLAETHAEIGMGCATVQGSVTVSQVDGVVMAQGSMEGAIPLLCSRCGDLFDFEARPRFLALYSRAPLMTGMSDMTRAVSARTYGSQGAAAAATERHARHETHGVMRTRNFSSTKVSPEVDDPALDITYLNEDFIDLAEILVEQFRLQIPFQPLCESNCRGLCQHCGANLNSSPCDCDQIHLEKPVLGVQLSGKVQL